MQKLNEDNLMKNVLYISLLICLLSSCHSDKKSVAANQQSPSDTDTLMLCIALNPDSNVFEKAQKINALMLESYPNGYELSKQNQCNLVLASAYVKSNDVPKIEKEVKKKLPDMHLSKVHFQTEGIGYFPYENVEYVGFQMEPNKLKLLQQSMVNLLRYYAVQKENEWIKAVNSKEFQPLINIGVAPKTFLDSLQAQKLEYLDFQFKALKIYQGGKWGLPTEEIVDIGL